jgi:hypothetical protein
MVLANCAESADNRAALARELYIMPPERVLVDQYIIRDGQVYRMERFPPPSTWVWKQVGVYPAPPIALHRLTGVAVVLLANGEQYEINRNGKREVTQRYSLRNFEVA